MTQQKVNQLCHTIIGAAIEVQKELGPGLLEKIYENCLAHLLREKGLRVDIQQKIPLVFRGLRLDCDLRYDLMVEGLIIVEVKAVEGLLPLHQAQLLTYLKLLGKPKGILINFNCTNIFKEGQKTMVTDLFSRLPAGY
jgi:GxxExxY protein